MSREFGEAPASAEAAPSEPPEQHSIIVDPAVVPEEEQSAPEDGLVGRDDGTPVPQPISSSSPLLNESIR